MIILDYIFTCDKCTASRIVEHMGHLNVRPLAPRLPLGWTVNPDAVGDMLCTSCRVTQKGVVHVASRKG